MEKDKNLIGVYSNLFRVERVLVLSSVFYHQPFEYQVLLEPLLAEWVAKDFEEEKRLIGFYAEQGNKNAQEDLKKTQGLPADYLSRDVCWDYSRHILRWGIDIGHLRYTYKPYQPVSDADKDRIIPLPTGESVINAIEKRFLLEFDWLKGVFNPKIQEQLADELAFMVSWFLVVVKRLFIKTNRRGVALWYGAAEKETQILMLQPDWIRDLIQRLEFLREELEFYRKACKRWQKIDGIDVNTISQTVDLKFEWGYVQDGALYWTESYRHYASILVLIETVARSLNKRAWYNETFKKKFYEVTRDKLLKGTLIFDKTSEREATIAMNDNNEVKTIILNIQREAWAIRKETSEKDPYTPPLRTVVRTLEFLGFEYLVQPGEFYEAIIKRTKAGTA